MRRVTVVLLTVLVALAVPHRADAWGFEVHKYIMERAIPLLPAEIRPFFEKYKVTIVEHAVDPDLWRTAGWLEEPPRHFVDMDAYGAYPVQGSAARLRPGGGALREGVRGQERHAAVAHRGDLQEAGRGVHAEVGYARENIKFFSSVIAHYTADAHVPFHAALNYDGQLTGQWGIHSRFESELFERYKDDAADRAEAGRADAERARVHLRHADWRASRYVQPALDARQGRRGRTRRLRRSGTSRCSSRRSKPILEKRLSDAISGRRFDDHGRVGGSRAAAAAARRGADAAEGQEAVGRPSPSRRGEGGGRSASIGAITSSTTIVTAVAIKRQMVRPPPTATPTRGVHPHRRRCRQTLHSDARTHDCARARKPIPVTICAAMRAGSAACYRHLDATSA